MSIPTLQQVLSAGNTSNLPIRVQEALLAGNLRQNGDVIGMGRITGYNGNAIEVQYLPDPNYPEIRLAPQGPNADLTRATLKSLGRGFWVFDTTTGAPLITTSENGLHCRLNVTGHISVAGGQYVESTEGFVRAATFLSTTGGIVRFMGDQTYSPSLVYDSDWSEYVFSVDLEESDNDTGTANIRAGNVISSKAAFYFNQNLMGTGPGVKISGMYNVARVEMPYANVNDYSYFKIFYTRAISSPVIVVTPWANNLSNEQVIRDYQPEPIIASIVQSTPSYALIRLFQGLCTVTPVFSKNYGMDIFNDIGFHFHVSSPLLTCNPRSMGGGGGSSCLSPDGVTIVVDNQNELAVNPANDSIVITPDGIEAAVLAQADMEKAVPSPVVGADNLYTNLTISLTPSGGSNVLVLINGVEVDLGNGVTTKDCYFTNPVTNLPRLISDIQAGDKFYWNALIATYGLDPTDKVAFEYDYA